MTTKFHQEIEKIAKDSLYLQNANVAMIEYTFSVFKRFIRSGRLLELGPAEGVMTDKLVQLGLDLVVVEGAESFANAISKRHPSIEVVCSLFEEFSPSRQFDTIILGHVLEHVIDPVEVLKLCKSWLAPDGVILAAVPNALSLHRQAAVIMGLMRTEREMSELDHHHGHLRIFDPMQFREVFGSAALQIEHFGGYWLKPVSNSQIHESWTPEMLGAFMKLGERYPDIAAEIYIVAKS